MCVFINIPIYNNIIFMIIIVIVILFYSSIVCVYTIYVEPYTKKFKAFSSIGKYCSGHNIHIK